jgi:aarF domain-containing kinase
MSGKRLLDAAALFKASRAVVSKHVELRRHNAEIYSKTSSLAKAVKNQTDRVTLTVQAASALAGRFGNSQSQYPPEHVVDSAQFYSQEEARTQKQPPWQDGHSTLKDSFNERSTENAAQPPLPSTSLHIQQEEAQSVPLADGSIPPLPVDLGSSSTFEVEPHATSAAETQIPGHTVQAAAFEAKADVRSDVYYTPSTESAPAADSLPEIQIPKDTVDAQKQDQSHGSGIDQDVFYSPRAHGNDSEAAQDQKEISEDMYAGLFHSPKVAKMMTQNPYDKREPKKMESPPAQRLSEPIASIPQANANVTDASKETTRSSTTEAEMHDLASELVADATAAQPAMAEERPYQMHESRVPSSRFGRIWQYGGLATSMAFGAVSEGLRRATGTSTGSDGSIMLSEANMERLVAKLSKMRGAALKLGQMMSFQDSKMLPPAISQVLQRVQDSADYMPTSQRDRVLASNLGSDWRDLFESFDEVPMAAASIGQVHGAVLKSSRQRVAVKVQYPGVANSISSDLSNLSILLNASRLLPKGLYLDKTIANARTELAWECDYIREAESAKRFATLLEDEKNTFLVPKIYDEASGAQVLTMERMEGVGVTKIQKFSQDQRDWIGTQILRLCLREITEFKFMQTDPNWTNFLFNSKTQKLELLDFGASRDFPDEFLDPYIRLLQAASKNETDLCRDLSIQLGYLTGHESKAMLDAHIESILTLAEPFRESSPDVYDFRDQTITDRVRGLIPVMIRERLAPPPEETYSLHRKLSGAFLLCARLGSRIECKKMFGNAMAKAGLLV